MKVEPQLPMNQKISGLLAGPVKKIIPTKTQTENVFV